MRLRHVVVLLLLLLAAIDGRQSAVAFPTADDRLPTAQLHLAQAKNPFAIAGREGGSASNGLTATILAWQEKFNRELQGAAKALKNGGGAFWTLAAASFAYWVFHAAGPGHGKAVLASYMIASRIALRRGVILAALAALLQGAVAIALVGLLAALLDVTATTMRAVADRIELASYAAIALVGLNLVWAKGGALIAALKTPRTPAASRSGLHCEAVDTAAQCGPGCGHQHAIDPRMLERGVLSGEALGAVIAAGLRPCSGAILILVFTLAQGVFWAGVAATLCMAAGTAITTAALAAVAVYARRRAEAWSAPGPGWTGVALSGAEFAAAALVLLLGVALLAGWSTGA